jgi:hypothetical protein
MLDVEMAITPLVTDAGRFVWPYQLLPQAITPPFLRASSCPQPDAIWLTPEVAAAGISLLPPLFRPHARTAPPYRASALVLPADTAVTPVSASGGGIVTL